MTMKLFSFIAIVIVVGCIAAFKPFSLQTNPAVKKIYLMRHARSYQDPKLDDFDRTIEEEGIAETTQMGDYLSRRGVKPDLIVASPSRRTRETTTIMCEKLGYDINLVKWDSTIYLCTTDALLKSIRATGKEYNAVLFIGHNNAMTHVANTLQSDEKIADMPPASVVAVAFRDTVWDNVSKGKLIFYKTPN
jgi:phosphohistidine phosphatase